MNLPIVFTTTAGMLQDRLKDVQLGCTPGCNYWLYAVHGECVRFTEIDRKMWDRIESAIDIERGK